MTRFGTLKRALIKVGFAAAIGCMQASPGIAGVQDSVFFINPDGSNVAFDVRDVSRREVLDRLLTSKSIELEWVDAAAGDERISGAFRGSTDDVLQRLLAQTDFVVVYGRDGDKTRIARLIIVGKAASGGFDPSATARLCHARAGKRSRLTARTSAHANKRPISARRIVTGSTYQ